MCCKVVEVKGVSTLLAVAVSLATVACSPPRSQFQESIGPTVDVPEFVIAIALSPRAENRLRSLGESMRVIAYFDGDPLPGQGKYNPPMRGVYLGMVEKLIDAGSVARFDGTKIPLRDWNRLSDKNYFVTINTVSARNRTDNNILSCADPISVRIDTLKGKTTEVRCWLIGESDTPAR